MRELQENGAGARGGWGVWPRVSGSIFFGERHSRAASADHNMPSHQQSLETRGADPTNGEFYCFADLQSMRSALVGKAALLQNQYRRFLTGALSFFHIIRGV